MNLTMYGYAKCGSCRSALKWLQARGHIVHMHNLFEAAPSAEQLSALIGMSGLDIQKFFNVSGDLYKEMVLKDKVKTMPYEEKLQLLAANGRLIKRPIVTDGRRVTVGYKEDLYEQVWGN